MARIKRLETENEDMALSAFDDKSSKPGLNDLKTGFSAAVNGVFIGQLGGLDAKLADGDSVMLMSLVTGG